MSASDEERVWDGISDEDLLNIDLDGADQQTQPPSSSGHKRASSEMTHDTEVKTSEGSEAVQNESDEPPLHALRGGYLWVSDLSSQMWCEQQLEYRLSLPPDITVPEPEQVAKGSELHLARELEVQDYVKVKVTSNEDIFAIKVLNLLIALKSIISQTATVHREVPIFGVVDGVFIMGKIDEVRVDRDTFHLDIVDLKTRKSKRPPGGSQKLTHHLQIMLYKRLFDDLVRGLIPLHSLTTTLRLNLTHTLGESVTHHITKSPLIVMGDVDTSNVWTLSRLLDRLKETSESLPFISQLFIDYVWQEDQQTFLMEEVKYDGSWLEGKMTESLAYWQGKRECRGVDIEDAWKCHSCDFQESCRWIRRRTEELIQIQRKKYKKL